MAISSRCRVEALPDPVAEGRRPIDNSDNARRDYANAPVMPDTARRGAPGFG
jgi:hypothetical protein